MQIYCNSACIIVDGLAFYRKKHSRDMAALKKVKNHIPGLKDKKWRKDGLSDWSRKTMDDLKKKINTQNEELANVRSGGRAQSQDLRIIVVGKSGHGKSSLINTINSALSGRVMPVANTGGSAEHVTNTYREYKCGKAVQNLNFNVVFGDLRGLGAEDSGASIDVVQQAILGRLPTGTKIEAGTKLKDINLLPERATKEVAMIFFVYDIVAVEHFAEEEDDVKSFKLLKHFCDDKNIAYALFLTKCDALDPNVSKDISEIHKSSKIATEVRKAVDVFSVQELGIFLVKNYVDQQIHSPGMAIQILYALTVLFDTILGRQFQKQFEEESSQAGTRSVREMSVDDTNAMSDDA